MLTKVEISHKTIIFTLVILAGIWLFVQVRDILLLLFVSFILMSAMRPIVEWFEAHRIPRIISILSLYAIVVGVFGGIIAGMVPALVVQSGKLFSDIPKFFDRMFPYVSPDLTSFSQQIAPVGENIVRVSFGVFSNLLGILTVLTFTFYFLLERGNLKSMLSEFLGDAVGNRVFSILLQVERRLGAWVLGELMLMLFIGTIVYIGLLFFRIDFALPLAIIAGILEIVPTIGPILSAIPAVLVAFSHSPPLALIVIALYIVVQQVENNIVVPLVMRKSVGLPPVLTLLALMIGGRLAGVVGAILGVPVLLTIEEIMASLSASSSSKR